MTAQTREIAIEDALDFADLIAKLLGTFFHCTIGNMDVQGESWGVRGTAVNPALWMEGGSWKQTQATGISAAKFGSLVLQAMHQPGAKNWATPFVDHPFPELKLTPYPGGVAYDFSDSIIGVGVSALAGLHDQLIATMLVCKCVDPGIRLRRVSVSGGQSGFDFGEFVDAARASDVMYGVQNELALGVPSYVFHLVSPKPEPAIKIAEFHSARSSGLVKPEVHRNFYIARSDDRPVNGVPVLGFTLYQS